VLLLLVQSTGVCLQGVSTLIAVNHFFRNRPVVQMISQLRQALGECRAPLCPLDTIMKQLHNTPNTPAAAL
jgi:hypothetical protein